MTLNGKTSSKLSILYVDDEANLLNLCKIFLEQSGDFAVTTSMSPPDAIHLLSEQVFDAIISDYQMPEMDGIEFLRHIRAKSNTTPFIIFTGRGREEVVIDAINAGVDFYLQKGGPPKAMFAELSHKVRQAVGRARAEEALRNEQEKYSKAFHSVPDMIAINETGTGLFLEINDAVIRIFGYEREELVGKSIWDLNIWCQPEDLSDIITRLQKQKRVQKLELRLYRKSGEEFTAEFSSEVITLGTNEVLLTVVHDITDRKREEEALRNALAEKETLLREVHYRVKTNLVGIVNSIDLQINSLTDPVHISQFKSLQVRIRSMEFVYELLYLSGDISRIEITTYLKTLFQYLIQMDKTKTRVSCKIESDNITMPIETAIPFGLIISEIVTNSLKYAFPHEFSCSEIRGVPCTITLTLKCEGSDYLLIVADNGLGIPVGTDVSMPRSLGLYLIRFIVEHQLQGILEISTTEGTVYTIRFPESTFKE